MGTLGDPQPGKAITLPARGVQWGVLTPSLQMAANQQHFKV